MTVHRILGLQNSGKTFYMSLKLFEYYLRGYTIYSNTPLKFPHIFINLDFLISLAKEKKEIENSCFGLDEFWIWADGRRSNSIVNVASSYILLQTSKNNNNVFTTAQTDRQDDGRIRDNAHFKTDCEREIKKDGQYYTLLSDKRILGEPYDSMLYLKFHTEKRGINGFFPYKDERIKAKRFFTLFDTKKRIYHTFK